MCEKQFFKNPEIPHEQLSCSSMYTYGNYVITPTIPKCEQKVLSRSVNVNGIKQKRPPLSDSLFDEILSGLLLFLCCFFSRLLSLLSRLLRCFCHSVQCLSETIFKSHQSHQDKLHEIDVTNIM